jgi:hypothetical protein
MPSPVGWSHPGATGSMKIVVGVMQFSFVCNVPSLFHKTPPTDGTETLVPSAYATRVACDRTRLQLLNRITLERLARTKVVFYNLEFVNYLVNRNSVRATTATGFR